MCYTSVNSNRFLERLKVLTRNHEENGVNYTIPYSLVDDKVILFDYKNENFKKVIRKSFKEGLFMEKWEECSKAAVYCCEEVMDEENVCPSREYPCPAVWDAWSCFRPGKAGTTVNAECPLHTYNAEHIVCFCEL